uniref:Murine leukemia virus integrase C-terminal domain-containing protein n=1 Tax=Sinocyclocheilus grahami TaxID=75366 RepID=A0A672QQ10_SINGR
MVVSLFLPLPAEKPTHSFAPGQQVLIKCLKPPKLGEPKYLGPATVIAVTRTGVLTDFQPQWIHASRLKAAPEDRRGSVHHICSWIDFEELREESRCGREENIVLLKWKSIFCTYKLRNIITELLTR